MDTLSVRDKKHLSEVYVNARLHKCKFLSSHMHKQFWTSPYHTCWDMLHMLSRTDRSVFVGTAQKHPAKAHRIPVSQGLMLT